MDSKKNRFKKLIDGKNKKNGEKPPQVTEEIINAHNEVHNEVHEDVHIDVVEIAKQAKKEKAKAVKAAKKKPVFKTRTFRIREDLLEAIDNLYGDYGEKQAFLNNLIEDHFRKVGKGLK